MEFMEPPKNRHVAAYHLESSTCAWAAHAKCFIIFVVVNQI